LIEACSSDFLTDHSRGVHGERRTGGEFERDLTGVSFAGKKRVTVRLKREVEVLLQAARGDDVRLLQAHVVGRRLRALIPRAVSSSGTSVSKMFRG
jgi:hypothetical protein